MLLLIISQVKSNDCFEVCFILHPFNLQDLLVQNANCSQYNNIAQLFSLLTATILKNDSTVLLTICLMRLQWGRHCIDMCNVQCKYVFVRYEMSQIILIPLTWEIHMGIV